jgi:hypothetical protein
VKIKVSKDIEFFDQFSDCKLLRKFSCSQNQVVYFCLLTNIVHVEEYWLVGCDAM